MTRSVRAAQIKLVIAIIIDIADFFIGRVPGFGTGFDVVATAIAFAMFGWKGLAYAWEVIDLTDQVDGFVPTLTLIALAHLRQAREQEGKKSAA